MESLKELAMFDVTIQGRVFTMRRRCTALMVLIGDIRTALGQLAPTKEKDLTAEEAELAMKVMADYEMKVVEVALVAIDGEEIEIVCHDPGPELLPNEVYANDLMPFNSALAAAFKASGLKADPIADS